jgi:seryl-tRNA synthetase
MGGGMSGDEEVRRMRKEVEELEAARLRLSGNVIRGDPKALDEDRQLERHLRDLARWITEAEQGDADERRAETERRGEQLWQAWREHHPRPGKREKRPKKGRP